jgi:hypothetical protein
VSRLAKAQSEQKKAKTNEKRAHRRADAADGQVCALSESTAKAEHNAARFEAKNLESSVQLEKSLATQKKMKEQKVAALTLQRFCHRLKLAKAESQRKRAEASKASFAATIKKMRSRLADTCKSLVEARRTSFANRKVRKSLEGANATTIETRVRKWVTDTEIYFKVHVMLFVI